MKLSQAISLRISNFRRAFRPDFQFVFAAFSAFGLASGISDVSKFAYYVVYRFHEILRNFSQLIFTIFDLPLPYIPRFEQTLIYASIVIFVVRGLLNIKTINVFKTRLYFCTTVIAQSMIWAAWVDHAEHYSNYLYQSDVFGKWQVTAIGSLLFIIIFTIFTILNKRKLIIGELIDSPSNRFLLSISIVWIPALLFLFTMMFFISDLSFIRVSLFVLMPPLLYLNPVRTRQLAALLAAIYVLAYISIPLDAMFEAVEAVSPVQTPYPKLDSPVS